MTKKSNFNKFVDAVYQNLDAIQSNPNELLAILAQHFPNFPRNEPPRLVFRKLVNEKLEVSSISKEAIEQLVPIISVLYPKPNTRKSAYNDWRKIIQKRFGDTSELTHHANKLLQLSKQEIDDIIEKQEVKLAAKHEDPLVFNIPNIEYNVNILRRSNDIEASIILVAIVTGSRLIEILDKATYEKSNAPFVSITGLVKRRGKDDAIERPILFIDYDELEQHILKIREQVQKRYNGVTPISQYWDARVNRYLKNLFYQPKITLHDMRRLYAALSFRMYAPENTSFNLWIKQVLGHESLGTSVVYQSVQLTDDPTDADGKGAGLVELNGHMIQKLTRVKMNQEGHLARIGRKIQELRQLGIEPTLKLIRQLGVGTEYAKLAANHFELV